MLNLYSLGMEKGLLYETIVTTRNRDGTPNAAPIGVLCKDKNEIVLYLFKGSKTYLNVRREKSFHVNILKDPLLFVQSTIGNLESGEFQIQDNGFSLKGADAFFKAEVVHERIIERKDQMGPSIMNIVTASVKDVVQINPCAEPLNRAIYGIIEALVYSSRIGIVSLEEKERNLEKINEISRVVNKVGGENHKKAMKMILEYLKDK
ncbi:MAG: DUF447 family protein [Methanobacteriaceae archaeon]|nr:DUF447 family protein [Methanobacteriaceae archaeon]